MAAPPHRRKQALFAALLVVVSVATLALGAWQVERRTWKLALIAAVAQRAHAPAASAPGPDLWDRITATADAYRHVQVSGVFDHFRTTRVEAVTGLGPGKWLLTPLRTTAGWTVLVNRGFVPDGDVPYREPVGMVTVSGLLRNSEPAGTFLRANVPAEDRWYSRDVAKIATTRKLGPVAPYFIDADAQAKSGYPIGGLTVLTFRNAHLAYAITWFCLSALSLVGLWLVLRQPASGLGDR